MAEAPDGMRIDWDVPIEMDDGIVLRADVFRPDDDGRHPVILSYGPYAKGWAFQEGYPSAWEALKRDHPDALAGSSNAYQQWEVVDPEKWVPDGYACVRVDSRGAGRSPGYIDHFSPRETSDFAACIEWAGTQDWSNGKVGLTGISYYAINQWHVAARQPEHLAAICPFEGAADFYRDMTHHGGIYTNFWDNWYSKQIRVVQYGLGKNGPVQPHTGTLAVRSRDYEWDGPPAFYKQFANPLRGCGPLIHEGRPPQMTANDVTVHTGGGRDAYLRVPVIPVVG